MAQPRWNVTRLGPGKLGIQCPRKDCHEKAVVSVRWLRPKFYERSDGQQVMIRGRSCTYCFQASAVPDKKEVT